MNISDQTFVNLSLYEAVKLLRRYGNLASWLLKPEVFEKADMHWKKPKLPEKLGGCWVLVRLEVAENSVFRSGAIIPLEWRSGGDGHDPSLPEGLKKTADAVLKKAKVSGWTLHLAVKRSSKVLRELAPKEEDWQSAWLPLYAGLKLAEKGLLPDPKVFATGAWEQGLQKVIGLKEKFSAVQEWDGTDFFCPKNCANEEFQKLDELLKKLDAGKCLKKLETQLNIEEALGPYLAKLAKEPDKNADWKVFDSYYALPHAPKRRRDFYLAKISPRLVADQRKNNTELPIEEFRGGHLAAWVSHGWEVILNDVQIFEPEKVYLLLAGTQFQKDADEISKRLNCSVEIKKLDTPFGIQQARELNETLKFPNEKESRIIFDLTLGNVPMSLALYDFPDIQPLFLYWDKEMNGPILIPSSSKLTAWQKNETLYRKENE